MEVFFYISLFVSAITFFITIYNLFTVPKFKSDFFKTNNSSEYISILIPARNEETNISVCINSILDQSHNNFELIILDDNSTDGTYKTVDNIADNENRIKLLKGDPLPNNWIGKNFACYQLYQNSKSDLLLFIDADVKLQKHALQNALSFVNQYNLSMLSCFPTQNINSFGEMLITPLLDWLLLSFLPLKQVFVSSNDRFVAANGQFIMIKKSVYETIGTHKQFYQNIVEDMEIARAVKSKGNKVMTLLGNDIISCRMYSDFKGAFNGFSKNFFAGFNTNYISFIIFLILILIVYLIPFIYFFWNFNFIYPIVLILLGRIVISVMSRQNIFMNIFLHPFQIILVFLIGINSMLVKYKKKVVWKERKY